MPAILLQAIIHCPGFNGQNLIPCPGFNEHKAAVKWFPEPQLIDDIAALTHACLATCSICDKFGLWSPNYPPNRLHGMDRQCPGDIVNKTFRTSTDYSPLAKEAPLLPESSPAFHSQALILCPGFNRHKLSSSLVEGEGRLIESVINKINKKGIEEHSPSVLEAVIGQSQAVKLQGQLEQTAHGAHDPSLPWPTTDTEAHWRAQEESRVRNSGNDRSIINIQNSTVEGSHVPEPITAPLLLAPCPASRHAHAEYSCTGIELVSSMEQWLPHVIVVEQCSGSMGIVSMTNGAFKSSYLVPEPPPACCCLLLGLRHDRELLWKPLSLEELKRRSINVARLRNSRMSELYSSGHKTTLMLLLSLLYSQLLYELWNVLLVR